MMMGIRVFAVFGLCLLMGFVIMCDPAHAQDREVPYWASLRYDEVRMRVGPSEEYPIEWVYKRKGLPVKVVRVREGWRFVEDPEGAKGWIARSQLDPNRGALVVGEGLADIRAEPAATSALRWRAEPGVVGKLSTCREDWCEINVGGRKGWVASDRLWGVENLPGDQ
ncbi:SH3 domain-containing protein [Erythrobacter sanguineus]|uniref:SH3-like domain-containing protein n=1 Tax=Erythrobacter sanguineus TaxID=198312 RepID=A0A1M7S5F2_9SPHN|nr:SH3-like domain-containing protein [Erythrobacter sanguineus]